MAKYLWNTTVKTFINSSLKNIISQLNDNFFKNCGEYPDIKQKNAWGTSIEYLQKRLANIDSGSLQIILEYQLPFSCERIDVVLIGNNQKNKPTVLIIEFKGWKKAKTFSSYQVDTDLGNQIHPDYQLTNYLGKLKCSHTYADNFEFIGVVILYNLEKSKCDLSFNNSTYFKNQDLDFENFLIKHFYSPTTKNSIYNFVNGKYTQNKKLFTAIRNHFKEIKIASHSVLADKGFGLSNEQLSIIEEIKSAVINNEKTTFLIQGAPGSGKTLLAIHLLINCLALKKKTLLGYRNNRLINSLRNIFDSIEPGLSSAIKFYSVGQKINGNNGNNGIAEKNFEPMYLDLVIYDEAQRMTSENIFFAMQRARVQVFFFDENQILNVDEKGTFENFKKISRNLDLNTKERFLNGYYRIIGGASYHNWGEEQIIGEKNNSNLSWFNLYDFKILDDFDEFISAIKTKVNGNRIALIASFTESPGDKKYTKSRNNLRIGNPLYSGFEHYKNYKNKIFWLMDPRNDYVPFWVYGESNKLEKCASIYGCQGFEADFVGLIWGRDFVIRNSKWELGDNCEDTTGSPNLKQIIKEAKKGNQNRLKQAFTLLQNRYRIFLTRGIKGTYVYFEDEETKKYFKEKLIFLKTHCQFFKTHDIFT